MTLEQSLLDLRELAERLRRECPWDREQTAATIVPHTVEEAYEVADAVEDGDPSKLVDELGDLLYQVYFLALLLEERGEGDLEDIARGIHEKLVRRHPHVFATAGTLRSAGEVKDRWEELKAEQEDREGIFHHLPEALPALLYARKVQRRAAAIGFEYPDLEGAFADLRDEVRELSEAIDEAEVASPETEPHPRHHEELGDVLFAAVNVARRLNVDPELALRAMSRRFVARVERAQRLASADGLEFTELSLREQDRYFDAAKRTS
ncbi:MAG: nucleoside triphosphate pyrophosphohydrolase [Candidatus Rokuibacteriota bacterium]|nr:MAG: nucleoside triphosphate pyrophosphohydrolase [Candidatus Rokubacteria bacterium]